MVIFEWILFLKWHPNAQTSCTPMRTWLRAVWTRQKKDNLCRTMGNLPKYKQFLRSNSSKGPMMIFKCWLMDSSKLSSSSTNSNSTVERTGRLSTLFTSSSTQLGESYSILATKVTSFMSCSRVLSASGSPTLSSKAGEPNGESSRI